MKKIELKVSGMHCGGCEANLKDFVSGVSGVKRVKADHKKGLVTVEFEEREGIIEEIKGSIKEAGYTNG